MPSVYLNGALVDEADAVVSVFDHGLSTGDGVFESVVVHGGRPFALQRHLQRLQRSASVIGLKAPGADELTAAVQRVLESAPFAEAKIRITVTGGPAPLGSGRGSSSPTVVVAVEELVGVPTVGSVVVAPWPKNERGATAGAKTTSYADNVVALAYATSQGATEALYLNLAGNLCEGTGSNIFLGIDGVLVTPPLSAGCLAGVTRGLIIEHSEVVERDIAREELAEASEAFLSSTTRGVQPVEAIDGRPLASCPGPLTSAAAGALGRLVARGEP